MLLGVTIVATSIIVSAIMAIVLGSAYEAFIDRRWPVEFPLSAVAVVILSVAAGAVIGSALG